MRNYEDRIPFLRDMGTGELIAATALGVGSTGSTTIAVIESLKPHPNIAAADNYATTGIIGTVTMVGVLGISFVKQQFRK